MNRQLRNLVVIALAAALVAHNLVPHMHVHPNDMHHSPDHVHTGDRHSHDNDHHHFIHDIHDEAAAVPAHKHAHVHLSHDLIRIEKRDLPSSTTGKKVIPLAPWPVTHSTASAKENILHRYSLFDIERPNLVAGHTSLSRRGPPSLG